MARISIPIADDAPHVLVVDDDSRIRSLLSRFLQSNGYRVTTAAHAGEAREHLRGLAFDLLVLDVMMPGENGFDLAKSLRVTSAVPILMLTARVDLDDRLKGLEIGADDYLGKPFDPRELLLRINGILRRVTAAPPVVAPTGPEAVRFGPFQFHLARGELRQGEDSVRITNRERDQAASSEASARCRSPRIRAASRRKCPYATCSAGKRDAATVGSTRTNTSIG